MSSKKTDDKKTIVIVGGGHTGIHAARKLSATLNAQKHKLVLVNPLPYRFLLPACLRLVVSDRDSLQETALVPYDALFLNNNGTFLEDSVTAIHQEPGAKSGSLSLRSGEQLPYDVLIICTGSAWEGPIAFPENPEAVKSFIANSRKAYESAQSYVLVGAGAVGLELAGEIRDVWPKKKISVVHNASQVLNATYPERYRRAVQKSFQARGIDLILGDSVTDIPEDGHVPGDKVTTRQGRTLEAGLVVKTWGARPNTAFVKAWSPDVVTDRGAIKIKPTFQVKGYDNVFAGGDIIDWDEQKQAAKARTHGAVIADNVLGYLEGKPFKEYKGSIELIALTNGKESGVSYFGFLWGIVLGGWVTPMLKSKSLGVPYFRGEMGK